MSLPEFSIRRPVTVLMACFVALLLGAISFVSIPVDLMPDLAMPTLTINTDYPGVAPSEVETLVTRPMEQIVSAAPGVEEVVSTSSEGRSSVRISFIYGTDIDVAADEVRSRLDRGRRGLPDDIDTPAIFKFDVTQFPILFLSVSADDMDARELRTFVERQIQYRIERIPGVGQVLINGGLRREIHVDLNLEKLRALNLSVADVVNTLRAENLNRPVGPVKEGRFDVLLRTVGEFDNVEQILNTALMERNNVPVYVRDVADVEDSHEEIRYIAGVDGNPALRLVIFKQAGANTVEISDGVFQEVARLNDDYDEIYIRNLRDSAEFIRAAISNVQQAALIGGFLAVIILLFFLRSWTSTMIIGTAIPISVIATFSLMYFNGFTLNTVSFGGLALGVGMLVDNAIVVLENIYRHREEGKPIREASILGSNEVAMAITASTLTTIAVFLPVIFLGGLSAQTFKQLAYVVAFSLLCSLIVALTVVPAMCSKFLRTGNDQRGGFFERIGAVLARGQDSLAEEYGRLLNWSLSNKALVAVVAVGLMASAYWMMPLVGVELEPQVDEGEIRVNLELESGTRVEVTQDIVERMRQVVMEKVPEVTTIMTEAGNNSPFRSIATHIGELRIQIVDQTQRTRSAAEIANSLRPLLSLEPGMTVRVRVSGGFGPGSRRGGDTSDRLQVEVRGYDPDRSAQLAEQVRATMMSIPGIAEAQISRKPGLPEMVVSIDRMKAASMGLRVSQVADTLETAVGGRRATMYREEGDEFDIVVRLKEEDRLELAQVENVPILTPRGEAVSADSVVNLQRQEGPVEIQRVDQERIVYVSAAIADRDLGSIIGDLDEALAEIPRPIGYEFRYGGEWEEQQETFQQLSFAALLALVLVYMVMAAQFESLRDPFIILFSIPLAFIGVVVTLIVTGTTFNMQGFLGVIVLVGIVVNNAIVLVDYTNQLREKHGMPLREAVVQAGTRRLRPILMTTITTVLGLLPMSLGIGEGSELQVPLARVVIGGLLTSTLITLVFIPVIYMAIESRGERFREDLAADQLEPVAGD